MEKSQVKCGPSARAGLLLLLACAAFGQKASNASSGDGQKDLGETQSAGESFYRSAKLAQQQGDLEGAAKYFQRSLSVSQELFPGSLAVAQSLNGLGDVAQQRGILPEAEAYYQRALTILQTLDPSGADAGNSLDGLARVANDRSDVAKFEAYALQAFSIRQKLDSNSLELALSLNNMAGVYLYRGQWDKAEESYKKALNIQEKLAPEGMVQAETLRNLGRFFFKRQRYDEAISYHQRALAIRRKLAPDGLAVADSLRWLGICTQNNADERERYYRAALDIQEKLAPGSVHVAWTLSRLFEATQARADLMAAEAYGRHALAIWEKMAPGGPSSRNIMRDLGNLLVWEGDLSGAEEFARKALEEDRREDPGSENVAWGLFTLGNIAIDRGDLVAADNDYQQALEISERVDPGGEMPARMMRGLGIIAEARGDLAKAEQYYRRALAIWEKTNPNGPNFAEGLFTIGIVAHDRGDLVQAGQCYRRALAIWEQMFPESVYVAQALGRLGQLSRDQGDLRRAEEYQRRAIAIEQKQAPGSADLAQGLSELGDVLQARGDLSEALKYQQQALAIRERLIPGTADHAASLAALAGIMRRNGQMDAAAKYYQQALDALENQAVRLGSGDELRAGFRARHAGYYRDYIDLLVGQKQFELAFQILERSRARTLLETLAVAHVDVRQGADSAIIEKEHSLQATLKAKSERRIRMLSDKHTDEQIKAIEKEISALTSEYQDLEARIRSTNPSYAALTQPRPLSAEEIQQQLLDPDTLLLAYSLGAEHSHVFAATRDSLTVFELPPRKDIEETARRLYTLVTTWNRHVSGETEAQRTRRLARAEVAYNRAADEMSRMILAPVAGQLQRRRLVVVADGALHYVPFAALPEPKATSRGEGDEAVPLALNHEIVNLPSASVLAVLRRQEAHRQPAPKAVAVLADAVFTPTDSRVKVGAERGGVDSEPARPHPTGEMDLDKDALRDDLSVGLLTRSAGDVGLGQGQTLQLPRLPFSRREADAIMAVTPDGLGIKAVDFDANRELATSGQLAQYRVVHFATHGLLNSQHPEFSGLVLSLVDRQGRKTDGFLRLQDIYNMNLSADLVVLSACETGLGKEVNGEGLIGLTRGFMYAGATRVVSSLWKVNDFATAKLMKAFYTSMQREGKRPAQALREAQLSLMQDRRWSSPYYWAGFTVQGEWK